MKPLSIMIDSSETMFDHEQVTRNFQEYCFSKGVLCNQDHDKIFCLWSKGFSVDFGPGINKVMKVRIYSGLGDTATDRNFTLPTDWKAFKTYLDEYIAFHQKPEPKIGEHWKLEYTGRIVEVVEIGNIAVWGIMDSDKKEPFSHRSFERPATPQEVAQYEKTRKDTALLEEARKRYPIGTYVLCVYDGLNYKVETAPTIEESGIWAKEKNRYGIKLYDINTEKWAEIIKEETREQQLEKALKVANTYLSMFIPVVGPCKGNMDKIKQHFNESEKILNS